MLPHTTLSFSIPGRPRAVQSVRFARIGPFLRKYQPQDVLDWKRYVALCVRAALPEGFAPFDGVPLGVRLVYEFAPPKSLPKRDLRALAAGARIYKHTKPDLADNLAKGLVGALTGVLWRDDSQIAAVAARKVYTDGPEQTRIGVWVLPQGASVGARGATSQPVAENPASELPIFAGNADSRLAGTPRSAPRPAYGKFPVSGAGRPS